jgi:hypothetical protein
MIINLHQLITATIAHTASLLTCISLDLYGCPGLTVTTIMSGQCFHLLLNPGYH